jgi:hypothetical protein
MRRSVQVEEAAKQEVEVQETVPFSFSTDYGVERYLKLRKHNFEELDQLSGGIDATTRLAAQVGADRQKLFLHRSVSRFKPEDSLLKRWVEKLHNAPRLVLKSSACIISLIQPNTKRPGRTFTNPHKPPGKYRYNDGLSYSAIVLLHAKKLPANEHDEASHLCGHGRCVNIAHLHWEGLGLNASRNECHRYSQICHHTPRCIPFVTRDAALVSHKLAGMKKEKKKKLTK